MASDVPEKAFAHWMTVMEAVQVLDSAFGTDSHSYTSKHTLIGRLKASMVTAAARTSTRSDATGKLSFAFIETSAWDYVKESAIFWRTGDLIYSVGDRYGASHEKSHFDVRFEPDTVRAIIAPLAKLKPKAAPEPPGNAVATAPLKAKGGRPPKDWWQDFWIEMCRLIYEGKIRPEMTQSDIQRLMLQWVSDHDHEAGETVIKDAARKLKNALKD